MSTPPRRLGAVGTLVWDRIRRAGADAPPVEQWGGAAYSLSALSAACPRGWEVVPLLKVGADLEEPARAFLDTLPGVRPEPGVRAVPEPNNRVELRYLDEASRHEVLTGGVPPWSWDELEPLLDGLDALYLNFISGYEMDLDTARRVRDAFAGPVYVDLHSLFLGPPVPDVPRAHRPLPQWREWVRCADVVQLNQTELELLGLGAAVPATLERLLELGPRAAVATLGGQGALFAVRSAGHGSGEGELRSGLVPPVHGDLPGDPTGCGDVWGSVVLAGLLEGRELPDAIRRGHRAAARKMRAPDTARLRRQLADELAG